MVSWTAKPDEQVSPHLSETTKPLHVLLNKWIWDEPQKKPLRKPSKLFTLVQFWHCMILNGKLKSLQIPHHLDWELCCPRNNRINNGNQSRIYPSSNDPNRAKMHSDWERNNMALTWTCERFADYLVGLTFNIKTDHKPFVPLFCSKNLDELPLQLDTAISHEENVF